MYKYKYVTIAFLLFMLSSCYYDNEEELYPENNVMQCDTSGVSYVNDVKPIIIGHCYYCHDNEHAALYGDNIFLEDFDDLIKAVEDGSFYGSISYSGDFDPMPKDYKLDSCDLMIIDTWIKNGAKND
ncbi:MAG: hypothetical protein Kow0068_18460 [Marinilabiliales bacterium]